MEPVVQLAERILVADEVGGSNPLRLPNEQVAWAAGLLEGEGSFLLKRNRTPLVRCQMTDKDVLERLHAIFGVGEIYYTKPGKEHHADAWSWQVTAGDDAADVMRCVRPWMLSRRGRDIDAVLKRYEEVKRQRVRKQEKIKEKRDRVRSLAADGLTHREIADEVGYHRTHVTKVLNGVR